MRTRIKFCGFTREEDVHVAVELGVDALGFVLVPASKRAVSIEQAVALRVGIPARMSTVALFQNPDAAFVHAVIERLRPDVLQFHGQESAEFCASFGRPYWVAVAMGSDDAAWRARVAEHKHACAVLLDAHAPGTLGGQGQTFDWRRVPTDQPKHLILAGGLRPENVGTAIAQVAPYAVDVSSGIEQSPGHKDPAAMAAFVAAVHAADQLKA